MAPLLVIDGDSLGHRAYHAMPAVEGAGGRPVGLLLGFANFLLATWRATQPRAVLVCLDTRVPRTVTTCCRPIRGNASHSRRICASSSTAFPR
jgi:5'-3' exonuclease